MKFKFKNLFLLFVIITLWAGNLQAAKAEYSSKVPSAADRTSIVIDGVEENCTVVAYHIIKPSYTNYGLARYLQDPLTTGITLINKNTDEYGDVLYDNPSYENITLLTRAIMSNEKQVKDKLDKIVLTYNSVKKTYETNAAKAGSYLVLVEKENGNAYNHTISANVYNPMWVSNSYSSAIDNSSLGTHPNNGYVNANETVVNLQGSVAYAKRSSTFFEKNIVNSSTGNSKVDDERVGDEVVFDLETVVPDYSNGYRPENIIFKITDNQSKGLDPVKAENIKVYLGSPDLNAGELGNNNYKLSINEANNSFCIEFNGQWIMDNPLQNLVVRYSTIINSEAVMAGNSNPNNAELEYTCSLTNETAKIKDKTRHYTFEFTIEKVDSKGQALEAAEFELVQVKENNVNNAWKNEEIKYTAISGAEGKLIFKGLEEGDYKLYEVKAPQGYALVDSTWDISIKPEYDYSNKIIDNYTVTIIENLFDGSKKEAVNNNFKIVSHKDSEDGLSDQVTYLNDVSSKTALISIKNTMLSKLPSVGGKGTKLMVLFGLVLGLSALAITVKSNKTM